LRVIYLSFFVVVIDQVTKLLVRGISVPFLNINIEGMHYGQSVDVFGSFFRFTFVENPGMAFGIEMGDSSKLFLSLFSIFASIGIVIYLYKIQDQRFGVRAALALILGGAVGNLIDRTFYGVIFEYAPLFYGSVVDFMNVDFFDFTIFGRTFERWPIFNVADAAVTIGVALLLIFHKSVEGKIEEAVNPAINIETEENNPDVNDEIENDYTEVLDKEGRDEILAAEDGKDNNRKEV